MESTGNYWLSACAILEDAGIEVCLVNARHVKGVPGKKTDVCDAAWLQQLHAAGLLKASFRPRREILPLRYLMRHRADLVAQAGQKVAWATMCGALKEGSERPKGSWQVPTSWPACDLGHARKRPAL